MAKNQSITNKLLNYFNISYNKGKGEVRPTEDTKGDDDTGSVNKKVVFPTEVEKLFKMWLEQYDKKESWENIFKVYEDMDFLYFNSALISRSIELVADEVVQSDSETQPIMVEAEKKLKQEILDFYDKIKLYDYIRPTAVDITQYGNAGWILGFDKTGVNKIVPTEVYNLKKRIEFTPYQVKEQQKDTNSFLSKYSSKVQRIEQLINSIENKDNITSFFDTYLFGFQVGDYVLPPWRFLHFRNLTTKSIFAPFGIPVFIHSIAPFRQLSSALTLQIIARGASFPTDVYTLNFPNQMNATEKVRESLNFLNMLQNTGLNATLKEEDGIGEVKIAIKDLMEYEQTSPDIDLGKIDDIEMLRDDLIISTFLPRNLIDPNDSSFGDSGIALVEKWKPFARLVYRIQSIILQQVSQLTKIHLLHKGYALSDLNFVLSMPFPEAQKNDEITRYQSDQLSLATDIIDAFTEKFFADRDAVLPDEVIKSIFMKFLPWDEKDIEKWISGVIKFKKENPPEEDEMF